MGDSNKNKVNHYLLLNTYIVISKSPIKAQVLQQPSSQSAEFLPATTSPPAISTSLHNIPWTPSVHQIV